MNNKEVMKIMDVITWFQHHGIEVCRNPDPTKKEFAFIPKFMVRDIPYHPDNSIACDYPFTYEYKEGGFYPTDGLRSNNGPL